MSWSTLAQLKERFSAATMVRLFDDNFDGTEDAEPVAACLKRAHTELKKWLAVVGLNTAPAVVPDSYVELELDFAMAFAVQRHPEADTRNWSSLYKLAKDNVEELAVQMVKGPAAQSQDDPDAPPEGCFWAKVGPHSNVQWDGRYYERGTRVLIDARVHKEADWDALVKSGAMLELPRG